MASGTGIGEFFVSLTVDAAEGSLTVGNLVQEFGQLEVATVAEIGLLWELGVLLARVTDAGIQASLGFAQFTMHTGLSAQQLQKWQVVAQQSHASAEDVTGSVENLTKHLANLAVGIPDAALGGLQQLFISPFGPDGRIKTAFQIMDELRMKLGGIQDAAQQERILGALGVSPNLRETLLLTNDLFNQRAALVPGMSAEQQKSLDDLRQAFVEIELKAKQIGIDIAAGIAPELASVAKWTSRVLEDFILIGKEVLKFEPVKQILNIGGAAFSTVGDLLDVVAGKGLDLDDINKQNKRITGSASALYHDFFGAPPVSAGAEAATRPSTVNIDKHDTYNIHDAHDPAKVKAVIEEHWDETMRKKTVDGFDRQLNNGGY